MILAKLCLALPLGGGPEVKWTAPAVFVPGHPFEVEVELAAPEGGATIAGWLLKPAAFTVDGEPLGPRDDKGAIELPSGFKVSGRIDLAPVLAKRGDFKLDYGTSSSAGGAFEVAFRESVPAGMNFMQMAPEELASYQVLLRTNRGDVLLKMWPDVAPGHVRNFLDLAYIKFYDGTIFHRVVANFMIQGGDPTGTGTGNGPRTLEAEFSDRRHVRGVISMARQGTQGTPGPQDPLRNSASCQFFIVQADSAHLDGGYSAFGEVVLGMDVVDEISTTSLNPGNRPKIPQVIERAIVVRVPGAAPAGGAGEAGGERSGGR
jgi:cyclophilin family peptidyl-prolyl cis-trans isomerase